MQRRHPSYKKLVFPPTAEGKAVKGKWELGIILAHVLSTSDKNFDKYSLVFIALCCSLENVFSLVTCQ